MRPCRAGRLRGFGKVWEVVGGLERIWKGWAGGAFGPGLPCLPASVRSGLIQFRAYRDRLGFQCLRFIQDSVFLVKLVVPFEVPCVLGAVLYFGKWFL